MSLIDDVEKLKKAAIPEVRETIADKISKYFTQGIFDEKEREVSGEILKLLAKDVEASVRLRLAENLKSCAEVPHDVIASLAKDKEDDVAVPILECSDVLTDEDLIEIIESTKKIARLLAIARRESISSNVCDSLVDKSEDEVIEILLKNKGADISNQTFDALIDEFKQNKQIIGTLIDRGDLSIGIVEKILFTVSGKMKNELMSEYNISEKIAKEAINEAREGATLDLLDKEAMDLPIDEELIESFYVEEEKKELSDDLKAKFAKVDKLVNHLYKEGRLTHSIIIRALCEGNLYFFESGLSRLAGIPTMNARMLIRDENKNAFHALCRRAKLPESVMQPLQIMIDYVVTEDDNGGLDDSNFKDRLMEHIISNEYDKSVTLMPYLMALIGSKMTTNDILG